MGTDSEALGNLFGGIPCVHTNPGGHGNQSRQLVRSQCSSSLVQCMETIYTAHTHVHTQEEKFGHIIMAAKTNLMATLSRYPFPSVRMSNFFLDSQSNSVAPSSKELWVWITVSHSNAQTW